MSVSIGTSLSRAGQIPRSADYTSKIIKAGALLADTRALFSLWDVTQSVQANLERIQGSNLLGKSSRARVEEVLAVFRQRYLGDPSTANALAILVQRGVTRQVLDQIFYFYAARADRLLRDAVVEFLAPRYWQGTVEVSPGDVQAFIQGLVRAGRTTGAWSELTVVRGARGLLATLRDFGILAGTARKRVAAVCLSPEAFAYVAFVLDQELRSGDRLLNSPEWGLFFLQPQMVERLFVEAQQRRLLEYHAAGRVIRIDFPASTIEDYAGALTQRAD